MNDETEVEALVRAALGGGEPIRAARLAALEEAAAAAWAARRRLGVWGRALLVAASLALVCGLGAWRLSIDRRQAQECRAVALLELLEESDGKRFFGDDDSFAERLVAWQDAPYEEAVR